MIPVVLNDEQVRVIGAMIEKQITTPLACPMTPNSVKVACNQKSNRNPVVEYDDNHIFDLLKSLERHGYIEGGLLDSSRTTKYRQTFEKALDIPRNELVILCELFIRGPQTPGELRGRCERMYRFRDIAEVEASLHAMAGKGYIRMLERQAGTKEHRWAHLFCGEPVLPAAVPSGPPSTSAVHGGHEERIATLEREVEDLRARLERLERH